MIRNCPLCGGEPKWVYHAVPMSVHPDGWEMEEDGEMHPMILWKHIECKACNALGGYGITVDQAMESWNKKMPLQYIGEESCGARMDEMSEKEE